MTSPIETNNVVELLAELQIAKRDLEALPPDKKRSMEGSTGFSADACAHLYGKAASTLQSLSDRIDVLEGENGRLLAAISWIEPPFVDRNTDVAELRKRVQFCVTDASRASLTQDRK